LKKRKCRISLDVDFSTPSDAASDNSFAAALESAGGSVVLPSFQQTRADRTTLHINRPLPQFAKHSWPALVNVEVAPDGLVRRYPFGDVMDDKFIPSLAGQHAERRAPFLIDFSIRTSDC
jgi:CHASE2 domain-containing sensor protein